VFALVRGDAGFEGYGWLTRTFTSDAWIALILLLAGVLIGFGAKTRRRLHLRQRADRDLDALARGARRHRDVLRHRDRRVVRDRGADVRLAGLLVGLVFGVDAVWTGMSDPDVIRGALLFEESYLFLFFASAVVVATVGIRLLRGRRSLLTRERIDWRSTPVQPRHIAAACCSGPAGRSPTRARADRHAARPGDRLEPLHARRRRGRNLGVFAAPAVRDRRLELLE
jgi:hypothetical protein